MFYISPRWLDGSRYQACIHKFQALERFCSHFTEVNPLDWNRGWKYFWGKCQKNPWAAHLPQVVVDKVGQMKLFQSRAATAFHKRWVCPKHPWTPGISHYPTFQPNSLCPALGSDPGCARHHALECRLDERAEKIAEEYCLKLWKYQCSDSDENTNGTFADSHKKPQYGSNIAQQNICLLVTIILRNEHGKIFPAFIFREFSQSWSHLAILSISCSFANNLHNRDNQEFHESAETGTLHKERTWSIALGGNMRGWQ